MLFNGAMEITKLHYRDSAIEYQESGTFKMYHHIILQLNPCINYVILVFIPSLIVIEFHVFASVIGIDVCGEAPSKIDINNASWAVFPIPSAADGPWLLLFSYGRCLASKF